jgi:uncharacterized protein (DUF58 family)
VTRQALTFVPTPRLGRLALVAAVALAFAVATGRGELAMVAVAPLLLVAVSPRSSLPGTAEVSTELDPVRCIEDDELTLTVRVTVDAHRVEVAPVTWPHTYTSRRAAADDTEQRERVSREHTATGRWSVEPGRWGRYRGGPLQVRVVAGNGMYAARFDVPLPEVVVYPGAAAVAAAIAPRQLPAPLGEHASRSVGSGVEFAGTRPYAPGDRRRDIDWRTSARHGGLYVRQYAAERAFDLVLVLDVGADAGPPGQSTLDLTVRAATGLAQTYLRAHDRVGLVTLGGSMKWLTPAAGPRQFHRIIESVMAVRLDESQVGGSVARLPRATLPAGAFVCVVSPMLDGRATEAVRDLRARGFAPLVVDVLTTEPAIRRRSDAGALTLRVWRMQREALRVELAALGVPVLSWDGSADLTGALMHSMRSLRPEGRS